MSRRDKSFKRKKKVGGTRHSQPVGQEILDLGVGSSSPTLHIEIFQNLKKREKANVYI